MLRSKLVEILRLSNQSINLKGLFRCRSDGTLRTTLTGRDYEGQTHNDETLTEQHGHQVVIKLHYLSKVFLFNSTSTTSLSQTSLHVLHVLEETVQYLGHDGIIDSFLA